MRREGQSLVETTLVLAAFMGLLLGVVDLGQKLFMRESLLDRARAAVRWGATHPYDPEAIRNAVLSDGFGGLKAGDIAVSDPGCPGPACRVRIVIAGQGVAIAALVERR